jgi:hypothetical protein
MQQVYERHAYDASIKEAFMNLGTLFLVLSLVIFALLGMGVNIVPRAEYWGFVCLVLGLLLAGYPWPLWPR